MSAKNAELQRTGSHHVSDELSSQCADGVGKEQIYLYFSATWRGKPVSVTMQADRYAASFFDEKTRTSTNHLTDWRTYASEARYVDPENNGGRGEDVTGTARSALSKLCAPMVTEWLASEAYVASRRPALARMIIRHLRDDRYSADRRVSEGLARFGEELGSVLAGAIRCALDSYRDFKTDVARVETLISEN